MAADDVPLTPMVVDCVTFDRAPLGRRGYNEDQVDDFLDRVQATLSGGDSLTANDVQNAMFDSAPLIRRGYHEDQVDEFLDLVVEELARREGAVKPGLGTPPAPPPAAAVSHAPTHYRPVPPPSAAEQTNPMLFAQPPSMQSPNTQPLKQKPRHAPPPPAAPEAPAAGPAAAPAVQTPTAATPPAEQTTAPPAAEAPPTQPTADQPTTPPPPADDTAAAPAASAAPATSDPVPVPVPVPVPAAQPEPETPEAPESEAPDPAPDETPERHDFDSWRDSDVLALPLPPAPPTERGYRPGDVERLVKLLAEAAASSEAPNPGELAELKLSRTFFIGQGYHAGVVDAVRDAWMRELQRRAL